jgi:hypothetical protein
MYICIISAVIITVGRFRDRLLSVWEEASEHYRRVVIWSGGRGSGPLRRALTALLRTSARLMRCHHCASRVLYHLQLLFNLPYRLVLQQADVVCLHASS